MAPHDNTIVWRWLHDRPTPPPVDLDSSPLSSPELTPLLENRKRKSHRSEDPANRQCGSNNDEILPDQSASAAALSDLESHSTSTRHKRTVDWVRDLLHDLRVSRPAILCDVPSTIALPERVMPVYEIISQSLEEGVIPAQLKDQILTSFPLVAQSIPDSAYDISGTHSDRELARLWESVIEILDEARDCSSRQQDGSQWCSSVIHPLLRFASKGSMLKVENVQTQTINPDLLPLMPHHHRIRKTADYAFSFHHSVSQTSELYRILSLTEVGDKLSQSTDPDTKRLILFSGLVANDENGEKDEALAQLALWLAAGMQHLRSLQQRIQPCSFSDLPPMIGWTVIGHDWHTYIAFGDTSHNGDRIHVLGPWRAAAADTRDVYGLFKLLKLLKRTMEYATTIHWSWLRENILQPLCSDETGR
ncbi:uncharacterized protein LDX57_008306 [Aspergillus melleus]|uniref:uncharacterized protein n=1 Tax=Aspergillus melleus TaxID=138277 RepID=UPI001E8D78D5|nr:uncharacterized protein LDX57_008306 [Aspergillus melleus]KAH8430643.1 hypothetical protein LDX57_008306 [Aspergillus melleus]